jgi:peroxiredoxin
VLALSVDDAESAAEMKDAYGLEFPVLYDTDTSVATEYGLYDLLGDGVSAPATFIIRTDGTIESALIGTTIGERPTPDSILEVLASLAGMDPATMADPDDDPDATAAVALPMAGVPEIGQLVPDFDLPTANGESVSLSENLGEGNVVLVFFRAWW